MNKQVVETLSQWLTATFNDYYTIWDGISCNQRFVHHPPESDNQNFVKLIEKIYSDIDFSNAECGIHNLQEQISTAPARTNEFIIASPNGAWATILITPYDEEVYHTNYIKEDKASE